MLRVIPGAAPRSVLAKSTLEFGLSKFKTGGNVDNVDNVPWSPTPTSAIIQINASKNEYWLHVSVFCINKHIVYSIGISE